MPAMLGAVLSLTARERRPSATKITTLWGRRQAPPGRARLGEDGCCHHDPAGSEKRLNMHENPRSTKMARADQNKNDCQSCDNRNSIFPRWRTAGPANPSDFPRTAG